MSLAHHFNIPVGRYEFHKVKKELRECELILDDILIEKDKRAYEKLRNQLRNLVASTFNDKRRDALNEAIEYLVNLDADTFTKKHIAKVESIIESHLGEDLAKVTEETSKELTEKIVKLSIKEVGQMVDLKLVFDVKDKEAAGILNQQLIFSVGDYHTTTLQPEVNKTLTEYFTSNKTIDEVAKDFEKQFQNITDKDESYFEGLAEHHANRTRELGHVNGYEQAGIEALEIVAVLDDRTSEICEYMNGQIIPIANAIELRDKILAAETPDEIKDAAPWLSVDDIKDSDLPVGMSLPPYHFRCRTTTKAYFK